MKRRCTNQGKKGFRIIKEMAAVADVLAMAFMFILLVLGAALMHSFSLRPLRAATDRQLELKSEHLYNTLEKAWVEPYSLSFLNAIGDNLVLENPIVPGGYLEGAGKNLLEYLRPPGYAVSLIGNYGGKTWKLVCPENVSESGKQVTRRGKITIMRAGGENVTVDVTLVLFKIS